MGEIGDGEKSAFLGNAQALLFPIDWPEPFGLVMIEAMACGTPVVAWRCGSVPEIVDHGVTGFIVATEDEAVAALARLHLLDRRRVRAAFEQRFTATVMARNYLQLYWRLYGDASRHGAAEVADAGSSLQRGAEGGAQHEHGGHGSISQRGWRHWEVIVDDTQTLDRTAIEPTTRIYRLTPINPRDPNWRGSVHRNAAVVRAGSEDLARSLAAKAFNSTLIPSAPGRVTPLRPVAAVKRRARPRSSKIYAIDPMARSAFSSHGASSRHPAGLPQRLSSARGGGHRATVERLAATTISRSAMSPGGSRAPGRRRPRRDRGARSPRRPG